MHSWLLVTLLLGIACTTANAHAHATNRALIQELGAAADSHVTTLCDANIVGPFPACFDPFIPSQGNNDYPFGSPEVSYPTDGTPWGVHLTGPYPDGKSYLVSWYHGKPITGDVDAIKQPSTAKLLATVRISDCDVGPFQTFTGAVIAYKRAFLPLPLANYSYVSPLISHVVLPSLHPDTTYFYQLQNSASKTWSKTYSFRTVRHGYPIRIGLMSDVGQTVNSSVTRDHMMANKPDVIVFSGDYSYADVYGAANVNVAALDSVGTNQNRWDTYAVLWESLLSQTPMLGCAGNHEIESSGISATINHDTTSFSYPTNYPFQTYAARQPVAGTTSDFGNINNNLYYSTVIGNKVTLLTLNNYIGFYPGSPQHTWILAELAKVDRSKTPWLFVQFHTPQYHTYAVHYKEADCFFSIYEDIFYQYGVDMVFTGHVHAYERTHPVYKNKVDTCAPMYVSIGDGGNVEGPYRFFVDQVIPGQNTTYCAVLTYHKKNPNQLAAANQPWGPDYQLDAQPPSCPTISWQSIYSVGKGPLLVPKAGDPSLGFCQSSQPLWSAHRDPSFGHAMLVVEDDETIKLSWYRNQDSKAKVTDSVTLKQKRCSPGYRRRMMEGHGIVAK